MPLSTINVSYETIRAMRDRLYEIEHGPRCDRVNWEQFHLYQLLELGGDVDDRSDIPEYHDALIKLAADYPELLAV